MVPPTGMVTVDGLNVSFGVVTVTVDPAGGAGAAGGGCVGGGVVGGADVAACTTIVPRIPLSR